jgi:phage tail-like protein
MPTSPNPQRFDPYKNFKFHLTWEGRPVAGVSKVSGLSTSPHTPGRNKFEPITLELGLTHDITFQKWANQTSRLTDEAGVKPPLKPILKDLVLEEYDEAGHKLLSWTLLRCWPSRFQSIPDLDGKANSLLIEQLVLENEGWQRDPG